MKINFFILFIIFILSCLIRNYISKVKENNEPTQQEMADFIDDFFKKDAVQHSCLDYQPVDKSICKISKNRRCILENHEFCYIDAEDTYNATEYAYRKLCKDKGHCPVKNEDGTYSCEFTKESCLAARNKQKDLHPDVLDEMLQDEDGNMLTGEELKEAQKTLKYNTHYWLDNIGCVDGTMTGIIQLENYCRTDHPCSMGLWEFDNQNLTCKITKKYCNEMKMDFNGSMCVPKSTTAEKLAGKFITRGLPCPRYANLWGGGVTNGSDTISKIVEEQCNNHLVDPFNKD